jgi:Flp pilus assembly protein TadG
MKRAHDGGSISLTLVVMVSALLVSVGLVVDGGAKLRAVQQATAVAGEAARAAAQQVNVAGVQTGGTARLDAAAARRAARATLADADVDVDVEGSVTVSPGQVSVTATVIRPTIFLSLLGVSSVTGSGSATADLTVR